MEFKGNLLVVIAVVVIAVISATLLFYSNCQSESSCLKSTSLRHQKILIILTQTRSGSSFTGEIFAASNGSLYFYEPLYPFGLKCDHRDGKEALLKQLLTCDFSNLDNIYSYGFNKSDWKDGANCRKRGFCFTQASTGFLDNYARICTNTSQKFQPKSETCGYPIRTDILTKLCKSKKLLITKITRICDMEELEKVYRHLVAEKRQVHVLHLIRDLRSIASSIIKLNKNRPSDSALIAEDIKHKYCKRQRHNLGYVEEDFLESKIIADARYERVRYEDLVKNPEGKAEEVFKFMGLSLPPEVVANIHNYLHPAKAILQQIAKKETKETAALSRQLRSPFGVVRDPTKVLDEWRKIVPFNIVQQIQEECGDVLEKNGYVMFSSEKQMKDLSLSSF